MPNLNKVFLMGHLTRDPEMRTIPSGAVVTEFGLAMNHRYTTKDGEQRDETCFVDCTVWGKTAEAVKEHLSKGSAALVEGRLKLDRWQDQGGNNRSKLSVVAERVLFLGSKESSPQSPAQSPAQSSPQSSPQSPAQTAPAQQPSGPQEGQPYQPYKPPTATSGLPDDDIPFHHEFEG